MATQDRFPTGQGSQNTFTSSTGSSKWLDVDDPVAAADDDSSYVFIANTSGAELYTFPAFDITSTALTKVSVTFRAKQASAGSVTAQARIRLLNPGANALGASETIGETYITFVHDFLTNPATGLAWTEAQIETTSPASYLAEIGLQSLNVGSGEELRVTQVYVSVTYTPVSAGNPWYAYAQQ